MTPRAGSWTAPSYPPPTGVLVGGPYGLLDTAAPTVQAGQPAPRPLAPPAAPALRPADMRPHG
ncbi:hypothetical protein LY625_06180 [Lysobacter sp. GX 14042]|uniref:hypothetical protein n=1 Tax=Lysobacter sp. GX 14042 TaxID=2907155 RepID=UPI001F48CC22|nr:hypothetical protein [Lysobacter sp. GX 14042]MCE7032208.1 hypothetical protein [Lysobacter sp. GX 14042]